MAQQMTLTRSNRYVNKTVSELQEANRSPIYGYKNQMIMTLEETIETIVPFVNDAVKYVNDAKQKCNRHSNLLTWDESAAIYLYTMSTPFFSSLNDTLRAENRNALKPWFAFLKLFMSALEKLPSSMATVWRAVSGDVDTFCVKDDVKVWWSVNSSSTALNVVQLYLGERGTLFAIETMHGKKIFEYSAFPDEQEVIVMPGTCLRVESEPFNFIDRLLIVHLKEESDIELNPERVNVVVSSTHHPSLTGSSSINMNTNDTATLLLSNNSRTIRTITKISRIYYLILMIVTILATIGSVGILFKSLFTSTLYSSRSVTVPIFLPSTKTTTVGVPQGTITTGCSHRQFNITADILYSFDCLSATDDISGTYNGLPATSSWMSFNNEADGGSQLPMYIVPDYSGQGTAIKLNSAKQYQYIRLIRSPIFFNQTFTISVWLNPIVDVSTIYGLISQIYKTAPILTFSIIEQHVVMSVYNTPLWSSTKLKNNQWQYVTFIFSQQDLSMIIYIDGILNAKGSIGHHQYGNFEIERTTIGSVDALNQYNGLMDQLSIAFLIKSNIDILDEATLVVHYNFIEDDMNNDFLFKDISVNSIRAYGSYVSHLTDSRHLGSNTLSLYDSALSYFQTGGFVLLSTHNYSYSYALWIKVSTISSFMPLVHLVTRSPLSSHKINNSNCLAVLTMNGTANNTFQLSVYIYGSGKTIIITSTTLIAYSTWFHVAFLTGTNNFNLYVNGILVASSPNIDLNIIKVTNDQRLTLTIGNPERKIESGDLYSSMCNIGKMLTPSKQGVIGVDDLRFYSRELKLKEIQALNNDDHRPTKFFFD